MRIPGPRARVYPRPALDPRRCHDRNAFLLACHELDRPHGLTACVAVNGVGGEHRTENSQKHVAPLDRAVALDAARSRRAAETARTVRRPLPGGATGLRALLAGRARQKPRWCRHRSVSLVPLMTRSGFPVPMRALLSCQSRSTWRAMAALDASGPSRSRAIDQSDSPARTTWVRSPRRARRPRTRAIRSRRSSLASVARSPSPSRQPRREPELAPAPASRVDRPGQASRLSLSRSPCRCHLSWPSAGDARGFGRASSSSPVSGGFSAVSGIGVLTGGGGAEAGGTGAAGAGAAGAGPGATGTSPAGGTAGAVGAGSAAAAWSPGSAIGASWSVAGSGSSAPASSLSATGGPEAAGAAGVSNGSWVDGPPGSKSGLSVGSLAVTSWGGAVPSLCWSGSPAIATGAAAAATASIPTATTARVRQTHERFGVSVVAHRPRPSTADGGRGGGCSLSKRVRAQRAHLVPPIAAPWPPELISVRAPS